MERMINDEKEEEEDGNAKRGDKRIKQALVSVCQNRKTSS